MKKLFFKILLTIIMFSTNANALKQDEIQSEMRKKIDTALSILEKKDISISQKGNEIIKVVDDVFDYELMAKIALGKETWNSINEEKQKKFAKVFEEKLKKSYVDKLDLYDNQKIRILDLKPYNNSKLQLTTELLGKKHIYQINYNFYNRTKDKEDWVIYDVDLVGVSVIQTYRQQFASLLKEKNFDEMLALLENEK